MFFLHHLLTSWVNLMWGGIERYCDWAAARSSSAADAFLILVLPVVVIGAARFLLPSVFFAGALLFLLPIFYAVAYSVYHSLRNH